MQKQTINRFILLFLVLLILTTTINYSIAVAETVSASNSNYIYLFKGGNFSKYDFNTKKILSFNGYPRSIDSSWKGLDKLPGGSADIDTAFKSADGKKYYIFKDDKYVEYLINKDLISNDLGASEPKSIEENWPGLEKFIGGASNIDAGFCDSEGEKYYIFKGIQYIKYDIKKNEIDEGYPKLISLPFRWRGLEDFKDGAGNFDAIVKSKDNTKYFFFKGNEYISYDIEKNRADKDYPKNVNENWVGLDAFADNEVNSIDAVIFNSDETKYYFFKGKEYISYDIERNCADVGWPGLEKFSSGPSNIDTILIGTDNKNAYFFKDDEYIKYDIKNQSIDNDSPKKISETWPGVFDNIDLALKGSNGKKIYFFKDDQYISFDINSNKIDDGFPKSIVKNWHGLDKFSLKSGSVLDGGFLSPDNKKYYFIKGDEYIVFDITNDQIENGYPKKINQLLPDSGDAKNYDSVILWPNESSFINIGFNSPVYFSQTNPKWANMIYSSIDNKQTIGDTGCGPTAMAMVISSLKSQTVDPPTLCEYSVKNNFRAPYEGTIWSFFPSVSKKYNIECKQYYAKDFNYIKDAVKSGFSLSIASMREGNFTKGGHFILITGLQTINGDMYYKILDPYQNNTNYSYGDDKNAVIDEIKNDGIVFVRENVLLEQSSSFWLFNNKGK